MTLSGRIIVSLAALGLSLLWSGGTEVCADEPAGGQLKIYGTIVDARQDISEGDFARLEQASSKSEAAVERILKDLFPRRPPPIATVTACSSDFIRTVSSDSEGRFLFTDMPQGIYQVSAHACMRAGQQGARQIASATKTVRVVETCGMVRLELHEELITISGRITDASGQPVAGAEIIGTAVPVPEVGLIDTVAAVSGADGSYQLIGFEPVDLYAVAGYLNGGSLDAPGALYTQVEIQVTAAGFELPREKVPRVPLITQTQVIPGQRLWKILSQLAQTESEDGEHGWREMRETGLPASQGSTITGVDIVLERVGQ